MTYFSTQPDHRVRRYARRGPLPLGYGLAIVFLFSLLVDRRAPGCIRGPFVFLAPEGIQGSLSAVDPGRARSVHLSPRSLERRGNTRSHPEHGS